MKQAERLFSYRQMKPPTGGFGGGPNNYLAYALVGGGCAGLGYLLLRGRSLAYGRFATPAYAQ
jgi:hypothetical protein